MSTKGANTRKKICITAAKLFSERGYKNVSMQDICNATGLSKGGLYRHFDSKSDLLFEIIKKDKRVIEDIEEGRSAVDTLENLLTLYYEDMKKCRESLSFALYEFAASDDGMVLKSGNDDDKQYWHRLVSYGVKTGEFNDIDPDVVMNTFLYAYRGVEMWGRVLEFEERTLDCLVESVRILLIKDYKIKESI